MAVIENSSKEGRWAGMAQNWKPWYSEAETFDFRSAGSGKTVQSRRTYTFTTNNNVQHNRTVSSQILDRAQELKSSGMHSYPLSNFTFRQANIPRSQEKYLIY